MFFTFIPNCLFKIFIFVWASQRMPGSTCLCHHQSTELSRFLSYISVKPFTFLYSIDTTLAHTTTFSSLDLCKVILFDFPRSPFPASAGFSTVATQCFRMKFWVHWFFFAPKIIPSVPSQDYFWREAKITLKELSVCVLWFLIWLLFCPIPIFQWQRAWPQTSGKGKFSQHCFLC